MLELGSRIALKQKFVYGVKQRSRYSFILSGSEIVSRHLVTALTYNLAVTHAVDVHGSVTRL